ncbi:hypothetical protein EMIT0180MI3_80045 [Priestia megaterium]
MFPRSRFMETKKDKLVGYITRIFSLVGQEGILKNIFLP